MIINEIDVSWHTKIIVYKIKNPAKAGFLYNSIILVF